MSLVLLRGTMNLKFKITASYFGSQEILTVAHMPLGTPFFHSQSSYQCLSVRLQKNSALVISFIPFKNFTIAWMDVVHGFFGMLSDCRLFTWGTRRIMFHSPRSPAPFALTIVGKIAVFALSPVNNACYFFL